MAGLGKRQPCWFRDRQTVKDTGPRFDKLSKADWADVFCDLFMQVFGEDSTPEQMMQDAEHRIQNLKIQEIQ